MYRFHLAAREDRRDRLVGHRVALGAHGIEQRIAPAVVRGSRRRSSPPDVGDRSGGESAERAQTRKKEVRATPDGHETGEARDAPAGRALLDAEDAPAVVVAGDRILVLVEAGELRAVDPRLLDELELPLQVDVDRDEDEAAARRAAVAGALLVRPTPANDAVAIHDAERPAGIVVERVARIRAAHVRPDRA